MLFENNCNFHSISLTSTEIIVFYRRVNSRESNSRSMWHKIEKEKEKLLFNVRNYLKLTRDAKIMTILCMTSPEKQTMIFILRYEDS
jgi:hypothetical protein